MENEVDGVRRGGAGRGRERCEGLIGLEVNRAGMDVTPS